MDRYRIKVSEAVTWTGVCSEIQNPEPMVTLSAHFVCSCWGHTNMYCLPTANSTAARKIKNPLLKKKKIKKLMKQFKGLLIKCPFRAESWKVLSFSVPKEGDWGMGRLNELTRSPRESVNWPEIVPRTPASYTTAPTTGPCFLMAAKHETTAVCQQHQIAFCQYNLPLSELNNNTILP